MLTVRQTDIAYLFHIFQDLAQEFISRLEGYAQRTNHVAMPIESLDTCQ
jgi:hypothetical protein